MSNDTEFTGPLFLQPSNPDDEQLPEITQPQPQSAFSGACRTHGGLRHGPPP